MTPSAMSLRNISLENYSYEMLKTHYHELFITTRTSIQDPSIRPQGGSRSNTFFIIEQGEYEGEEGFWVEDEEGLEGFMSNNDEETFWVLEENDAFIARKVSGRNFKFKKRKGKGKSGNKKGSPQRGAGWTDQDWDQSWTWNEHGWYSSYETSSTGQALMAFHDAYEYPGKKAIHEKLIQSDAVSEHNLSVTTNHGLLATKLMAPVINPQHNPTYAILDNGCTRSMGSWHAIQRFTQAIEPMKDIISYEYIPAETKFTFANGETARVNWTLHLRYHTTPPCSTNIDILEQGTVPILLSISQMRNLYMTPKIIGSQKQDHWILDKKTKQLIRVRITPRKALFTPNGAKECPITPDHISRERTTEIIDASAGGDPDILEDNWRLTSQANNQ